MQQLSGLDAAFLGMETRTVHGHVGSVCLLDPSSVEKPLTLARLTALVASRIHLIPAFRRRLVAVPFGIDHPYWIEDPDLDLEFHVRELGLPPPGDDLQLSEQVARIHARHLDRTRPLWELYLIHAGPRALAIYLKVHHAAIDGVSGNDLIAALMDLEPSGRQVEQAPPLAPDREPGSVELVLRGAISFAAHPARLVRTGVALTRSAPALAARPARRRLVGLQQLVGRKADVELPTPRGLRAPATPFNGRVTAHRRWTFRSLPFAEVKAVKHAYGTTVNDVVMALCAGALRAWLECHDALPTAPLVAAVPVSIRTAADTTVAGNRISVMMAPIPTHIADPVTRLRAAHQSMRAAKEVHGALPANLLADVAEFAMPALVGRAARLSARLGLLEKASPFNLIISNVPGPQQPLYYAGAKLLAYYPLSAVTDGQGLNISVITYDGHMDFGLISDRDLVPDLERIGDLLVQELGLLAATISEVR